MNELLGDKLIYRAVQAKMLESEITFEDAAIDALIDFELPSFKILELRNPLAKAVEFVLTASQDKVDQQR